MEDGVRGSVRSRSSRVVNHTEGVVPRESPPRQLARASSASPLNGRSPGARPVAACPPGRKASEVNAGRPVHVHNSAYFLGSLILLLLPAFAVLFPRGLPQPPRKHEDGGGRTFGHGGITLIGSPPSPFGPARQSRRKPFILNSLGRANRLVPSGRQVTTWMIEREVCAHGAQLRTTDRPVRGCFRGLRAGGPQFRLHITGMGDGRTAAYWSPHNGFYLWANSVLERG